MTELFVNMYIIIGLLVVYYIGDHKGFGCHDGSYYGGYYGGYYGSYYGDSKGEELEA